MGDDRVPKSTDASLQCCASQELAQASGAPDHLVLPPSDC
jgi:hypothetical protein